MRALFFSFVGLASCSLLFRELIPRCDEEALADCSENTLVLCQEGFVTEIPCEEKVCLRDANGASCVPLGCGDGSTEGDEECDDGNNESGDGCSFDCLIEACQTLSPLPLGVAIDGDTSQNGNNFETSCISTGQKDQAFLL